MNRLGRINKTIYEIATISKQYCKLHANKRKEELNREKRKKETKKEFRKVKGTKSEKHDYSNFNDVPQNET
ncbi:hypothetical protein HYE02_02640 [Mycoplasmopsis bovis]|nr:hypothetical protein [Mycoplasmopsis bovis]QQH28317.1 hypothetical protein HYE02_02640 [Mycoplasmopsis bovis]